MSARVRSASGSDGGRLRGSPAGLPTEWAFVSARARSASGSDGGRLGGSPAGLPTERTQ